MIPSIAFTQPFSRVNSGTRLNIQEFKVDIHGDVYFLTDKISILRGNHWQRLDLPFSGRISHFCPITQDDIWFSTNEENYTSQLYHYHKGVMENVKSPFSNLINQISYQNDQIFFCSLSEIAAYRGGQFHLLPPSPSNVNFIKTFAEDESRFWALGFDGDLFRFRNNRYEAICKGKLVKDFCMTDISHGYILLQDAIAEIHGENISRPIKDTSLVKASRIQLLSPRELLIVGRDGFMAVLKNGILWPVESSCSENLEGITVTRNQEIWVNGGNGRLLYHGPRRFPPGEENLRGFSSQKLIALGVNSDNEYGVALADVNGDELPDIYAACIYNPNRLYINRIAARDKIPGISGFIDEAALRGATGTSHPGSSPAVADLKLGVLVSDFDNDGDQDLYLNYLKNNNRLLLNNGNGHFRSSPQGNESCRDLNRSNATAAADIDLDGDLDLFVTSEEGSNRLFLNDGTAHFTDITATAGLATSGGGMCASFADINNDGLPDLGVTFWYPCNRLYLNESRPGRVKFREITAETDLIHSVPAKSNAIVFGDVNNDGAVDLFIGNRNQPDKLYLNNGHGVFSDISQSWFPEPVMFTNGAVMADFDMDGYLDLYLSNIGDNKLLKNRRGAGYDNITADFGAEMSGYGTGCATADVDNDADADLFCATYVQGSSRLFLNITDQPRSVEFILKGTRSNSDAVGAKIWLYMHRPQQRDSLCGYREVTAGGGYASSSSKQQVFGMEPGRSYYALIVFPARKDTIRVESLIAGRIYKVNEEIGIRAVVTNTGKTIHRWFTDREKWPELLKYCIVILAILLYGWKYSRVIPKTRSLVWLSLSGIFVVFGIVNYFYLYSAFSFQFFISLLVVGGLGLILHLFIVQYLAKRAVEKGKRELREKLSRDLHDDLASTLGSISIYSSTLNNSEPGSGKNFMLLTERIDRLTRQALHSIADIIWMTSPRNDSLQSLLSKTGNDMMELLTDNGIRFIADIQIPEDSIRLPENVRNDAYLILKEGMHNCIKHSGAGEVRLSATVSGNSCEISFVDNGKGFDPDQHKGIIPGSTHGNGLLNMKKRAEESGIDLSLQSGPPGTTLSLRFRI